MDVLSCKGVSYGFVLDFHLSCPGWNFCPPVLRHSLQTLLCLSSSEALAEDCLLCHSQLPCEQKANGMPKKTNIQPVKNIPVALAGKWLLL